ncbi:hypothetical protein HZS_4623, partial [Henneguya salminicola]
PLLGSKDCGPICYLLKIENLRILLDCGWDYNGNIDQIGEISNITKQIDAVLLSSCDISRIGAYPYLFSHCGLTCPVFATYPITKMGHLALYDYYQSIFEAREIEFTLDDIDNAINHLSSLKYSQKMFLKGGDYAVSVTAYPSGVTIGSSVWFIEVDGGESRIVYAPELNHQNDRHLNSIALNYLLKPTLLICGAYTMDRFFIKKSIVESMLISAIKTTTMNGGNVTIITDTSGRCLELLLILAEYRDSDAFVKNTGFIFVNHVASHVIEFAKFHLEWMNENLLKMFQTESQNPFIFSFIKTYHNFDELSTFYQPTILLVSDVCLEDGKGLEYLTTFSQNPLNKIIFTKSCETYENLYLLQTECLPPIVTVNQRHFDTNKVDLSIIKPFLDTSVVEELNDFSDEELVETEHEKFMFRLEKPTLMHKNNNIYRPWDSYGEIIKVEDFITLAVNPSCAHVSYKSKQLKDVVDQAKGKSSNSFIQADPSIFPHYFSQKKIEFVKKATVDIFMLDGLADSESLLTVIRMINPQNLIIIHGSVEKTQQLHDAAIRLQISQVYSPDLMSSVILLDERKSLRVRLKNQLISSLNFVDYDHHQVAWIDFSVDSTSVADQPDSSSEYILDLIQDYYHRVHKSLFLNELKFSQLCQSLTEKGYQVTFQNGVLNCND